jgi:hypothetical protein
MSHGYVHMNGGREALALNYPKMETPMSDHNKPSISLNTANIHDQDKIPIRILEMCKGHLKYN